MNPDATKIIAARRNKLVNDINLGNNAYVTSVDLDTHVVTAKALSDFAMSEISRAASTFRFINVISRAPDGMQVATLTPAFHCALR